MRCVNVLKEQMAKMEVTAEDYRAFRGDEDSKIQRWQGKDRTMLDEKRRVTIGYVDDNNQRVEMKVPVDEFRSMGSR